MHGHMHTFIYIHTYIHTCIHTYCTICTSTHAETTSESQRFHLHSTEDMMHICITLLHHRYSDWRVLHNVIGLFFWVVRRSYGTSHCIFLNAVCNCEDCRLLDVKPPNLFTCIWQMYSVARWIRFIWNCDQSHSRGLYLRQINWSGEGHSSDFMLQIGLSVAMFYIVFGEEKAKLHLSWPWILCWTFLVLAVNCVFSMEWLWGKGP